jgi:hypothetical protein
MLLDWYAEYADQAENAAEAIAINVSRFGFSNRKLQSFPPRDEFGLGEGAGTDAGVGVGAGVTDEVDAGNGAGAAGLIGAAGCELLGPCDGGVPEVRDMLGSGVRGS